MRCAWAGASTDYIDYHDREWGRPTLDDRWLFEKICLEGFQSGLSWLTILRKRDNFRRAFSNFDVRRVARFGDRHIEKLLADAGIVRHRGKIASTINNAARALELLEAEGTLASYVWRFEPATASRPKKARLANVADDGEDRGIDRALEGPEETRMELRRAHHDVHVHAERRNRE